MHMVNKWQVFVVGPFHSRNVWFRGLNDKLVNRLHSGRIHSRGRIISKRPRAGRLRNIRDFFCGLLHCSFDKPASGVSIADIFERPASVAWWWIFGAGLEIEVVTDATPLYRYASSTVLSRANDAY